MIVIRAVDDMLVRQNVTVLPDDDARPEAALARAARASLWPFLAEEVAEERIVRKRSLLRRPGARVDRTVTTVGATASTIGAYES